MAVYLVDRDLPRITRAGLLVMQRTAITACQEATAMGTPVRYLHGIFIIGEARCLSLFEADDEAAIVAVNQAAQLPFTRIVDALDLTPEQTESGGTTDDA